MKRKKPRSARRIYLTEWLEFFDVGQEEAGKAAGCSQGYLSNIGAQRKTDVNVLILLPLSEYLGITVNDLYRPPPSAAALDSLTNLSSGARETIVNRPRRKA